MLFQLLEATQLFSFSSLYIIFIISTCFRDCLQILHRVDQTVVLEYFSKLCLKGWFSLHVAYFLPNVNVSGAWVPIESFLELNKLAPSMENHAFQPRISHEKSLSKNLLDNTIEKKD